MENNRNITGPLDDSNPIIKRAKELYKEGADYIVAFNQALREETERAALAGNKPSTRSASPVVLPENNPIEKRAKELIAAGENYLLAYSRALAEYEQGKK
jgi:hypothetical protein